MRVGWKWGLKERVSDMSRGKKEEEEEGRIGRRRKGIGIGMGMDNG